MPSHALVLTRDIAATPERVWAVLTDLESAATTLSQVTHIEVLTPGPYGVGTRWRETRRMLGREETQEMWVAASDAPREQVILASAGGVDYTTTFTLEPIAAGTRLTMRFAGESKAQGRLARVAWAVLGPLGMRITRTAMTGDLDDIAAAAAPSA